MKSSNPEGVMHPSPALMSPPKILELPSARPGAPETVLTETMRADEPLQDVFHRLAARLAAGESSLLGLMIYGSMAARDAVERAMRLELGETCWPVTWVEGASCDGAALAGVQAFAISGRPVTRVRLGNRIVGSVYEDGGARHCLLGGVGPTARSLGVGAQVQQTFGNLEWALDQAGFELGDVVRTWFYNEDILSWYGEFNRVRSAHYGNVKFRTGSLPASTGIGARNIDGAALTVAAWAVRPIGEGIRAKEIGSPLQCPAPAYGSSFSRAMEIDSGGWRRLLISGTASIHPGGKTAWVDDPKKQVDLTMEVIAGILQSRGMDYRDVTRATAYYRDPAYLPYFTAWCAERNLENMPVVHTHSVVCRDDLLFELELDAGVAAT
jgi:enamine deaminase RidA (YjgF/YER057c/UK114 family)